MPGPSALCPFIAGILAHLLEAGQRQLALENLTKAIARDSVQEKVDAVIKDVEKLRKLHDIRRDVEEKNGSW